MEHLDALRLVVGALVLAVAAAMDLRTRRVPNRLWAAGGAGALSILAVELVEQAAPLPAFLALLPIAVLVFDALWDRPAMFSEDSKGTTAVALLLYVGALAAFALLTLQWLQGSVDGADYYPLVSIIGMILFVYLMYAVRLLRGGADAKALMAVAVLVPRYPVVAGLPVFRLDPRLLGGLELLFPFALVTLLNAAILTLLVPLCMLVRNALRGDLRFPLSLFGLRVPLDEVPKFTWLMERVVDGEVQVRLMPRGKVDREGELLKLAETGRTEVWVTPQIPFVVMILLGFLTAFALGNFVFVLTGAAA